MQDLRELQSGSNGTPLFSERLTLRVPFAPVPKRTQESCRTICLSASNLIILALAARINWWPSKSVTLNWGLYEMQTDLWTYIRNSVLPSLIESGNVLRSSACSNRSRSQHFTDIAAATNCRATANVTTDPLWAKTLYLAGVVHCTHRTNEVDRSSKIRHILKDIFIQKPFP